MPFIRKKYQYAPEDLHWYRRSPLRTVIMLFFALVSLAGTLALFIFAGKSRWYTIGIGACASICLVFVILAAVEWNFRFAFDGESLIRKVGFRRIEISYMQLNTYIYVKGCFSKEMKVLKSGKCLVRIPLAEEDTDRTASEATLGNLLDDLMKDGVQDDFYNEKHKRIEDPEEFCVRIDRRFSLIFFICATAFALASAMPFLAGAKVPAVLCAIGSAACVAACITTLFMNSCRVEDNRLLMYKPFKNESESEEVLFKDITLAICRHWEGDRIASLADRPCTWIVWYDEDGNRSKRAFYKNAPGYAALGQALLQNGVPIMRVNSKKSQAEAYAAINKFGVMLEQEA